MKFHISERHMRIIISPQELSCIKNYICPPLTITIILDQSSLAWIPIWIDWSVNPDQSVLCQRTLFKEQLGSFHLPLTPPYFTIQWLPTALGKKTKILNPINTSPRGQSLPTSVVQCASSCSLSFSHTSLFPMLLPSLAFFLTLPSF